MTLPVVQEREAVVLLAEIFVAVARQRDSAIHSASSSGSTGATGSVVPFPARPGKARAAA